jgi:predicted permease
MLIDDLRRARRRITARPAVPLLSALLLAVGIGLTTAMFSVIDSLLLLPAPFRDADRLVRQGFWRPELALMDAWRTSGMFEAVGAYRPLPLGREEILAPTGEGALVTPGVFDLLGVRALHGRTFESQDARPGSDDVVMLSETLWRSAFGADRGLLGRRINVNGQSLVVIGIMPAAFRFPEPSTVLWRPFDVSLATSPPFWIVARLESGVPFADVEARTALLARQLARLPRGYSGAPPFRLVGSGEIDTFTGRALWLLLGGVALVFLVLCANVTSLLLTHLSERRREFGLCAALGASRVRLIRQAAAEHALIAALGTALGIGVAWFLVHLVPGFFLGRTLNVIDIDVRAVATASVLGTVAVVLAGLVPAWLSTRGDPVDACRIATQIGTETRASRATSRGLLTVQISLACSLLVGSTLLIRSFANLANANRGLQTDGVLQVSVQRLDDAFPSAEAMALGVAAVEANVKAWPEIESVALSREIPPLTSEAYTTLVRRADPGDLTDAEGVRADRYRIAGDFFDLYRIPILRGRTFEPGGPVSDIVVGERLAALLWPAEDALGQPLRIGRNGVGRVVGVVGETSLPTLQRELDRPELYMPLGNESRTLYLNLRCRTACPGTEVMRSRLADVHPAIVARAVAPSENTYLRFLDLPRALAEVGGLFTFVAILTAAGGLFTVMTQAAGRRRREFGIRVALGASPGQLGGLVYREGLALVCAGTVLGIGGGWITARALSGLHYGVTPGDAVTWGGVVATIVLTSLAAGWRPARQAMRLDPVKLLREE